MEAAILNFCYKHIYDCQNFLFSINFKKCSLLKCSLLKNAHYQFKIKIKICKINTHSISSYANKIKN